MEENHKEFWSRFQNKVDVVVASRDAEQLLGVRDGFRRYFQRSMGPRPRVSVRSAAEAEETSTIWTSAETTLAAAHRQAASLRREVEDGRLFCIAAEEGLATVEVDGVGRSFVHCWTVVASPIGTACGGSGPVEIPERFTQSVDRQGPVQVPGTRRRGGILGSLTGGLESRREAFSLATFHALSSLFFGLVEARRRPGRWND